MLGPTTHPVAALMKKTFRKPTEAGVTSCQDNPPSTVRSTPPPPTTSKPPTANAVSASTVSKPLKVKSGISNCSCQLLPPSVERQSIPLLPPKNAFIPPAQPVELS